MSKSPKKFAFMPPPPLDDSDDHGDREEPGDLGRGSNDQSSRDSVDDNLPANTLRFGGNSTWSIVKKNLLTEKEPEAQVQKQLGEKGDRKSFPSIPGYEITKRLGRGGMGMVFLARDRNLGRLVAIKTLTHTADHLKERFDSEAKAVAALQHPNIAQLFAADEINGDPYFVMEYVDGETLEEFLDSKPQEPKQAAELMLIISRAIAYTHEQGLLHRDLKPSNILLTSDGTPKVADFGLAKSYMADSSSTQTGEILGTPSYMAPEQATGVVKNLNETCDVYGLGAMLYKLLTGYPPFVSSDPMQTVMSVIKDDPIPPRRLQKQTPRDLENICLKCLNKKPERRYASAIELADDLNRFINGQPVDARPISIVERSTKWIRRRPATAALIATSILVAGLSIAGLVYHNNQLEKENTRSSRLNEQLKQEVARSNRLNEQLKQENTRSNRLIDSSNQFALWITNTHLLDLQNLKGSTPHRKALAEKLQFYLDELFDDAKQEPEFIAQLASSYSSFADVLGNPNNPNMGMLEESLANYERSNQLAEQSLKMRKDSVETGRILIAGLLRTSDVHFLQGDMDAVKSLLVRAKSELDKGEPTDNRFFTNLEIMYLQRVYDVALQEQSYDQCNDILDQLANKVAKLKTHDDAENDYVQHFVHLKTTRGELHRRMDEFEESEAEYQEAYDVSKADYERDTANARSMDRYLRTVIGYGDIVYQTRRWKQSLELFEETEELRRNLLEADPTNVNFRRSLAVSLSRIADALNMLEESERAIKTQTEAVGIVRQLLTEEPSNIDLQRVVAKELGRLSDAYVMSGEIETGLAFQTESLDMIEELMKTDPDSLPDLGNLAEGSLQLSLGMFLQYSEQFNDPSVNFDPKDDVYIEINSVVDRCINAFKKIQTLSKLNALQQNNFNNAQQLKTMIVDWAQQMQDSATSNQEDDF